MNQILSFVIISALTLVGATVVTIYVEEHMEITFESRKDAMDNQKLKQGEILKLIDVLDDPLGLDVMNLGSMPISVKRIFVDGIEDTDYIVKTESGEIMPDNITRIIMSVDGENIVLISENNIQYNFKN